jgi:organic hydroperoxide reductase OsmC/OhrA
MNPPPTGKVPIAAPNGDKDALDQPRIADQPFPVAKDYKAIIDWLKKPRARGQYSRDHAWTVGAVPILAIDLSAEVPTGCASIGRLIPEEAFIAAIASCHMLTFLHLAISLGVDVLSYHDEAVGVMTKNEAGVNWISEVTLHPTIRYGKKMSATREAELQLHKEASAQCFIELSIKTRVNIVCSNHDRQTPTR